jgi:hypothetical protein
MTGVELRRRTAGPSGLWVWRRLGPSEFSEIRVLRDQGPLGSRSSRGRLAGFHPAAASSKRIAHRCPPEGSTPRPSATKPSMSGSRHGREFSWVAVSMRYRTLLSEPRDRPRFPTAGFQRAPHRQGLGVDTGH